MKNKWMSAIAMGALTVAALSFGEEEVALETTAAVPAQEQFIASVEIAPAITVNPSNAISGEDGVAQFENEVTAGYQFDQNLKVQYNQPFVIEMANSNSDLENGSLRGFFDNIYNENSLTYGLEPRVYLPTSTVEGANEGMVTQIQLKNKFAYRANGNVSLLGEFTPAAHIYDNSNPANPDLALGVKLGPKFNLTEALTLSVPVEWVGTRAGVWTHEVTFWPELEYNLPNNMSVGGAYRSASLVDDNFGGRVGDALAEGAVLGFFRASL